MTAQRILFSAGILVALLPFLGFPAQWDTVFYVLLGLFVAGVSFSIKDMHKKINPKNNQNPEPTTSFVENDPVELPVSVPKRKKVRRIHPTKESESTPPDSIDA
jgi:hypothetical protein